MITKKTVLILGAGASQPFGYPTGKELFNNVCTSLYNPSQIKDYFDRAGFNEGQIRRFANTLYGSGTNSIDEFLEHNPHFVDIGKLAIASELLKYENGRGLYIGDNWYKYIFGIMNSSFDDFYKNNVSFVTFNYDRSLEYFLFNSLKNKYGKSFEEVAASLRKINIIHLHGELCKLPYLNDDALNHFIEWDSMGVFPEKRYFEVGHDIFRPYEFHNLDFATLFYSARGLKIIHDEENAKEFEKAIKLINEAKRVYFLGFGYHPINLTRLKISELVNVSTPPLVAGTSIGLTDKEKSKIEVGNRHVIKSDKLVDCDIVTFFRSFWPLD